MVSGLLLLAAQSVPAEPPSAATVYQEATVKVRIEGPEDGLIDKCQVTETTAPPALADKVCPIFVGKRVKVGEVDKGTKRFTMSQTIRFRLPN